MLVIFHNDYIVKSEKKYYGGIKKAEKEMNSVVNRECKVYDVRDILLIKQFIEKGQKRTQKK